MAYELVDNEERRRYEFHINGETAYLVYIRNEEKIFLTHVEVPRGLEGKGIGSALVSAALEDIQREGLIPVPYCSFVRAFIRKNPEWQPLVEQS